MRNISVIRKVLSFVILVCTVFSLVLVLPTGVAADAALAGKTFDIIEITDFHGMLENEGYPCASVLAANIRAIKDKNPERTFIVGDGDLYWNNILSNVFHGTPAQKVLNSIGMEVSSMGNHELEWGWDILKNVTIKDSAFPIVCCNYYDSSTGERIFQPYTIINKDGLRIAVIGATSKKIKDRKGFTYTDPTDEINNIAKEIRDNDKADMVIAAVHEGGEVDANGETKGFVYNLAKKVQGIDMILGGDSHNVATAVVNGMPVCVGGCYARGFIHYTMTVGADGKFSYDGGYVAIDNDAPNGYKAQKPMLDEEVSKIVEDTKKDLENTFSEVIGNAAQNATRDQDVTPYGESYLGNWICDNMKSQTGSDVAIFNTGGLRTDIPKGDITVKSIYDLMPADNVLVTYDLKKSELKGILEQAFNDADPDKKIDQGKGVYLAGIKVSYDLSRPSYDRILNITREDGSVIGDDEDIKVVTITFIAEGGGGFTQFTQFKGERTNYLLKDILIDNIKVNGDIFTNMNNRLENNTALDMAS